MPSLWIVLICLLLAAAGGALAALSPIPAAAVAGWIVLRWVMFPSRRLPGLAAVSLGGWVALAWAAEPWLAPTGWGAALGLITAVVTWWEGDPQPSFKITEQSLARLKTEGVTVDVLEKLQRIKHQEVEGEERFLDLLKTTLGDQQTDSFKSSILTSANLGLRPKAGPRWMIVAVAALAQWRALAAFYDAVISDVLINLWGHLGVWLSLLVLLALAIVSFALLSFNWLWRLPLLKTFLNRRALVLLERWDSQDPLWKRYFELRHKFHQLLANQRADLLRRLLRKVWEYTLGKFPSWIIPTVKPNRVEKYLRAQLRNAQREVSEETSEWRAARLSRSGDSDQAANKLRAALDQRGKRLLALGDYLFCPHEPCPHRLDPPHTHIRKLAFAIDAHLHASFAFRSLTGVGVGEGEKALLTERLGHYYRILHRNAPELRGAIEYRIAMLEEVPEELKGMREGQARDDLDRLRLRKQIVEWARRKPPGARFVLDGLLAEYQVERDSAGLIETCRQLGLLDLKLSATGKVELGEAYYWYAYEIDPTGQTPLSVWAFDQAVSHFFEAGAEVHLDVLSKMKGEARTHVA